ncbi:UDP-N-acetylmuramate--L-alanine ligase [Candidatus Berkelbacteria bacterium]|nr:UDP-N-acetylmuramate--L-alanine ligase [Candidatus Berkelbacteria bacterium]
MRYHLIGIKGSSMSGLVKILEAGGHKVTGSDLETHNPKNITKDIDWVVVSAAITAQSKGYIEVEAAQKLGIPVISRSKLIGKLMSEQYGIAIAGMHGKSTVTAMVGLILEKAGLDPTVLLGAETKEYGNVKLGHSLIERRVTRLGGPPASARSEARTSAGGKGGAGPVAIPYFVVEACEYERQFLDFRPKAAIILNIEEEHLDTYPKGLSQIINTFKKFVDLLPKNGILIGNADDKNQKRVLKSAKCKVKTFSQNKPWPGLKLKIPGRFNLTNATAAARLCHELKVDHKIIKEALNNFTGIKRRMEVKGEKNGILVLDDYAHHPTEIQKTLEALKEFYLSPDSSPVALAKGGQNRRLIVVFQPHQYTRTKLLFKYFGAAFKAADQVILADIFAVPGRDFKKEVKEEDLVREIAASSKPSKGVKYLGAYPKILSYLQKTAQKTDIIVTMGATKIYEVGERFIKNS